MILLVGWLCAAVATASVTPLVKRYARQHGIVDDPAIEPVRRVHHWPTPLLGGVAIWLSIVGFVLWFTFGDPQLVQEYISREALLTILLAATVLMIGGYVDDVHRLAPRTAILFPIIAAGVTVIGGIGVHFISRPWGGIWRIDGWKLAVFTIQGATYDLAVIGSLFTFAWLMGMMYTTKFLDGLDGLVSGVVVIGALVIMGLSLTPTVHQPDTALLAALIGGAFLGFLPYNWSPAKIFLGDGGSLLAGYLLGVLAIIAGGKLATTLLVVGIPVLDVVWVLLRRWLWDRSSLVKADRKHLHFRLLDVGFSPRQVVGILWGISLLWGVPALFLKTRGKMILFSFLFVGSLLAAVWLVRLQSSVRTPRS